MKIVLVIFFLTIQSSYLSNSEIRATNEAFDTVQFVATDAGSWRIKTYATDQDVHTWLIGNTTAAEIVDLARNNTEKNYGDVLAKTVVIETTEGIDGVRRELLKRGISDHLEISKSGFVFWTPKGTHYHTQSTPR